MYSPKDKLEVIVIYSKGAKGKKKKTNVKNRQA